VTEGYLKALGTTSRVLGLDREVALALLDSLIAYVLSADQFASSPEISDAWLAPRVHAALRLRRSEAADRRLWTWLAIVRYDSYVRWRWPGVNGVTARKRFTGSDRDNALSRLWWGAELTRNGGNYDAAVDAFRRQDIPSTWFVLDAFHNRAAALAAMRILPTMGSKPINRLSSAFNHFLTTIMLDTVAPLPGPDLVAMEEWIMSAPSEEDLLQHALPIGPLEDPVDESAIAAVEALVRRVAAEVGIPLEIDGEES
jgi:hypothetical protein